MSCKIKNVSIIEKISKKQILWKKFKHFFIIFNLILLSEALRTELEELGMAKAAEQPAWLRQAKAVGVRSAAGGSRETEEEAKANLRRQAMRMELLKGLEVSHSFLFKFGYYNNLSIAVPRGWEKGFDNKIRISQYIWQSSSYLSFD